MNGEELLELFLLKSASMRLAVDSAVPQRRSIKAIDRVDENVRTSVAQFSKELRDDAEAMSEFYKLFYMLENL